MEVESRDRQSKTVGLTESTDVRENPLFWFLWLTFQVGVVGRWTGEECVLAAPAQT